MKVFLQPLFEMTVIKKFKLSSKKLHSDCFIHVGMVFTETKNKSCTRVFLGGTPDVASKTEAPWPFNKQISFFREFTPQNLPS